MEINISVLETRYIKINVFSGLGDHILVSKTQKYIDFDISGLQDRYIGLHDGLRIESPLISVAPISPLRKKVTLLLVGK